MLAEGQESHVGEGVHRRGGGGGGGGGAEE